MLAVSLVLIQVPASISYSMQSFWHFSPSASFTSWHRRRKRRSKKTGIHMCLTRLSSTTTRTILLRSSGIEQLETLLNGIFFFSLCFGCMPSLSTQSSHSLFAFATRQPELCILSSLRKGWWSYWVRDLRIWSNCTLHIKWPPRLYLPDGNLWRPILFFERYRNECFLWLCNNATN